MWVLEMFKKKRIEQRVHHNLLQKMHVKDRKSYFKLFVSRFSESNEEKCMAFQSMAWSLTVHKNTIKNCLTALQAFSFWSLSLYPLFSFS